MNTRDICAAIVGGLFCILVIAVVVLVFRRMLRGMD